MKNTNIDVIQSYLLTTARYDYSVHEKRILYRIVQLAQADLDGKKLDNTYTTTDTIFNNLREVVMPASMLLNKDESKNYAPVRKALKSLRDKSFEHIDKNGDWKVIGVIEMPKFKPRASFVSFYVHREVWDVMLDFAKGFRRLELKTAMSFETVYSMRFYELFSEKKTPITYTIDNLKIMFGLEDKYKKVNDFIKRVIIPAKTELDKKSPYSFEYKILKLGRKITSIKFYPCEIAKNRDVSLEKKQLEKQVSLSWDIDKTTVDYLEQVFGFTADEIKRNLDLFKLANSKLDLLSELSKIKRKALDANKGPKPYVIGTLKRMISQSK